MNHTSTGDTHPRERHDNVANPSPSESGVVARPSVKYCVITKAESDVGNMAAAFEVFVQIEEGSQANGWLGRVKPLHQIDGRYNLLNLRAPAFHVGEILIVDEAYGREYGYPGRKPSKWGVEAEYFDDVEAAIARSREVMDR